MIYELEDWRFSGASPASGNPRLADTKRLPKWLQLLVLVKLSRASLWFCVVASRPMASMVNACIWRRQLNLDSARLSTLAISPRSGGRSLARAGVLFPKYFPFLLPQLLLRKLLSQKSSS